MKFINATELDRKSETSFTNEGNLQAPELFLCPGAVHPCDDDVLDIRGALVLLSLGRRDLHPLW